MKRGGPPERRTPLASGDPLRRRTRLKPRSARRAAVAGERRAFVEAVLRAAPRCELPVLIDENVAAGDLVEADEIDLLRAVHNCAGASRDVHEILSRGRGGAIVPSQGLDRAGVLALCRPCHDWVTTHPRLARHVGALAHSWEA